MRNRLLPSIDALVQYTEGANKYHAKANKHRKGFLDAARMSGSYLLEAKKELKHGNFKKWLKNNFKGSYPTASAYMRIAKKCDDPEYTKKLQKNNITSINGALDILKAQRPEMVKKSPKAREKEYIESYRHELRGKFGSELLDLTLPVLELFDEHFENLYDVMFIALTRIVEDALGYDPDDELLQKMNDRIDVFAEQCKKGPKRKLWSQCFREGGRYATMDMKKARIQERKRKKAVSERLSAKRKRSKKKRRKDKRRSNRKSRKVA